MSEWGIGVGEIIKDFNEKLEKERKKVKRLEALIRSKGLTIDDWYKMNHHDWKDVVNEHNDLLAEVERLRGLLGDYRRFHTWIGEKDYELIAEWDEMESEEE